MTVTFLEPISVLRNTVLCIPVVFKLTFAYFCLSSSLLRSSFSSLFSFVSFYSHFYSHFLFFLLLSFSTILSDLIGWAEAYVIKTGTASASSKALLARNSSSMSLSLKNYRNSTISVNSDSVVKNESTETTADDGEF